MKKPIDPNLDNILDDILASESKASESVLPKNCLLYTSDAADE